MTSQVPFRHVCEDPKAASALEVLRVALQHTGTRRKNECPAPLLRLLAEVCEDRAHEAAVDRDGSRPTAEEMRWLRWRSWLNDVANRVEREMPGAPAGTAYQDETERPRFRSSPPQLPRSEPIRIAAG